MVLTQVTSDAWRHAPLVGTKENGFRISLFERLQQSERTKTKEEKDWDARLGFTARRAYDHKPSGQLTLEYLDLGYASSYGKWSDGKTSLESKLGDAALGVADVFRKLGEERARHAEKSRVRALEVRRRDRERRRAEHETLLRADLDEMATNWERAKRFRAFVDAAEPEILTGSPDPAAAHAWIAWARQHANALDPLSKRRGIAKVLEPAHDA